MLHYTNLLNSDLYSIIFYFFIFSFLGWVMETCLCSYTAKAPVNRGFLNGPICPIYGFGMSLIIIFLTGFKDNVLLLFIGGFIFATALEYFVGFLLKKLFHAEWWDYSDKRFNIKGRICLQISLSWGILSVIMILWVVPFFEGLIRQIDIFWGHMILYALMITTVLDTFITVYHLYGLNRILDELTKISAEFKRQYENSDVYLKTEEFKSKYGVSFNDLNLESLKPNIISYKEMSEKWKNRLDYIQDEMKNDPKIKEISENITELRNKYSKRVGGYNWVQARILKAFPNFKPNDNNNSFSDLKEKIKLKMKRK